MARLGPQPWVLVLACHCPAALAPQAGEPGTLAQGQSEAPQPQGQLQVRDWGVIRAVPTWTFTPGPSLWPSYCPAWALQDRTCLLQPVPGSSGEFAEGIHAQGSWGQDWNLQPPPQVPPGASVLRALLADELTHPWGRGSHFLGCKVTSSSSLRMLPWQQILPQQRGRAPLPDRLPPSRLVEGLAPIHMAPVGSHLPLGTLGAPRRFRRSCISLEARRAGRGHTGAQQETLVS